MSYTENIPISLESPPSHPSLLATVGNALLRSAFDEPDQIGRSLVRFAVCAALVGLDRLPTLRANIAASMPEDGNNIDRGLLALHEVGILHTEPRFFRRTPDGTPVFYLHPKFRTMTRDSEAEKRRIEARRNGESVKGELDRRTLIGRYLEATSLDELPSFINLFRRDQKPSSSPRRFRLALRGNVRPKLAEEIDSPIVIKAYESVGRDHTEVQCSPEYQPCAFPITSVFGLRVVETEEEYRQAALATIIPRSQYPKRIIRSSLHPRYRKQTSFHRQKQNSPVYTEEFDMAR